MIRETFRIDVCADQRGNWDKQSGSEQPSHDSRFHEALLLRRLRREESFCSAERLAQIIVRAFRRRPGNHTPCNRKKPADRPRHFRGQRHKYEDEEKGSGLPRRFGDASKDQWPGRFFCQGPYGDEIDARFGNFSNVVDRQVAGGFEFGRRTALITVHGTASRSCAVLKLSSRTRSTLAARASSNLRVIRLRFPRPRPDGCAASCRWLRLCRRRWQCGFP